jgi:AraC-like DNA-binding protein
VLGLEAVAADLRTSRATLQRAFQKAGTSFTTEQMGVRMRAAMSDALDTLNDEWNPKRVAERYGFGDPRLQAGHPGLDQPTFWRAVRAESDRFARAFFAYWELSVVEVRTMRRLHEWLWSPEAATARFVTATDRPEAIFRLASFVSAIPYTDTSLDDQAAAFPRASAVQREEYESRWEHRRPYFFADPVLRGGSPSWYKYPPMTERERARIVRQGLTHRLAQTAGSHPVAIAS